MHIHQLIVHSHSFSTESRGSHSLHKNSNTWTTGNVFFWQQQQKHWQRCTRLTNHVFFLPSTVRSFHAAVGIWHSFQPEAYNDQLRTVINAARWFVFFHLSWQLSSVKWLPCFPHCDKLARQVAIKKIRCKHLTDMTSCLLGQIVISRKGTLNFPKGIYLGLSGKRKMWKCLREPAVSCTRFTMVKPPKTFNKY